MEVKRKGACQENSDERAIDTNENDTITLRGIHIKGQVLYSFFTFLSSFCS